MKQSVIALKKYSGMVEVQGVKLKMNLPDGCTGICFCFESKKSARKHCGRDVELLEIDVVKPKPESKPEPKGFLDWLEEKEG